MLNSRIMSKNNFLLVDLNEKKTGKLAKIITSDTSRNILNYLTEKEDSEQNIAQTLNMPISTVHYHLQKLQEAGLVKVEEFHYSKKGREVNHYKLVNKYIIIAPKNVKGLKSRLKEILPAALIVVGISGIIPLVQKITEKTAVAAESGAYDSMLMKAETIQVADAAFQTPNIALWFFVGAVSTIILLVILELIREKIMDRSSD